MRPWQRTRGPSACHSIVSFYTHISDQFGPFYTKVIAATASEAPHVLDGLLYHDTGLAIEEHYTDSGGVTDHVFGLCHLFGFPFAPRIRDIKERKLYLLPDQKAPASLVPLVGGVIDTEHIAAHWDQLLPLATSIRTGTTTSSAVLKKLSAYPRQNGLAKALREMGRIERTLFTLDWIKNPDLRRRAHLGLNKGEACNALARAVYFCRLGEVRDRSFESQFFRASGLNLLVAAIILWNTKYLEMAYLHGAAAPGRDDQRGPGVACSAARLGTHRADRRLRLEHCRSTAGRYPQTAAATATSTGGLSSLNVPDVVHAEHFRVVTP